MESTSKTARLLENEVVARDWGSRGDSAVRVAVEFQFCKVKRGAGDVMSSHTHI